MENNKDKITYNRSDLLREISLSTNVRYSVVEKVYDAIEEFLLNHLSEANLDNDVSVRLFKGLSINSEFLPSVSKINNITGKSIMTNEKLKAKAKITRQYCEKLTEMSKAN